MGVMADFHADPNSSYARQIFAEGLSSDGSKEDFSGDNRELCPKAGGALNNGRGRPAPSLYFLTAFAA